MIPQEWVFACGSKDRVGVKLPWLFSFKAARCEVENDVMAGLDNLLVGKDIRRGVQAVRE